jgi:hypothetical protein
VRRTPRRPTTYDDLVARNVVQTCTLVLRREQAATYAQSWLADQHYAVEDWPLCLHVAAAGPLGFIPISFATYRRVVGSVTNQGHRAAERLINDQMRLLNDAGRLCAGSESSLLAGLRQSRWALGLVALRAGDRSMVRRAVQSYKSRGSDERPDPRMKALGWATSVPGVTTILGAAIRMAVLCLEMKRYRQPAAVVGIG